MRVLSRDIATVSPTRPVFIAETPFHLNDASRNLFAELMRHAKEARLEHRALVLEEEETIRIVADNSGQLSPTLRAIASARSSSILDHGAMILGRVVAKVTQTTGLNVRLGRAHCHGGTERLVIFVG